MSPTGLKEFIESDTEPQERTIRKVAEVYRRDQRAAEAPLEEPGEEEESTARNPAVAERRATYSAVPEGGPEGGLEEALRKAMPKTRERALRWVEKFFAAVWRHMDEFPAGVEKLEEPLLEYARRLPPRDPPGGKAKKGRKKK
ncbi:MAG TPA: hypothetical protein VGR37_14830 [Longimicrobiaceae bacterium]|nr:hypothetical protein [Longimicrobiaceae bacterium]